MSEIGRGATRGTDPAAGAGPQFPIRPHARRTEQRTAIPTALAGFTIALCLAVPPSAAFAAFGPTSQIDKGHGPTPATSPDAAADGSAKASKARTDRPAPPTVPSQPPQAPEPLQPPPAGVPGIPGLPGGVPPMPPPPPPAPDAEKLTTDEYVIAPDQTHVGDLYLFADRIVIEGTQDGDLTAFARSLEIRGKVTGDIYAMLQRLDIPGEVGDSVRVFAQDVTIGGTVDGDLLAWGSSVRIEKGASVTKNLKTFAATVRVDGTVGGNLSATSGEVLVRGEVKQDANITCDRLEIADEARIHGDLTYESRLPLDIAGKGIVSGDVSFEEKTGDEEESEGSGCCSGWTVFWFFFQFIASLLAGLLMLVLTKGSADSLVRTISSDMLRTTGVGFLALVVIPVAAIISCIFIVTIPVAILVLMAYVALLWLAKLPVAVWMGQRLLRLAGRAAPSPYTALLVGLVPLYALFAIPVVRWFAWFAALFIGFGAMMMLLITRWQERRLARFQAAADRTSPPGPPPGMPPSPPAAPPPGPITFGSEQG